MIALRKRSPFLVSLLLLAGLAARAADKAPPPSPPANTYGDADSHPGEGVTVAAEPFTGSKAEFFKINYPAWGIMPVRLIVTNDTDRPISLAQARIDFITAAGDKIPAAQIEDIERMIDTPPNPNAGVPIGPIRIGGKGKNRDKQILADNQAYAYASIAVEAHSTRSGFLFYDVSQLGHPLVGAKLEVRKVRDAQGKELFAFEVPFYKLGPEY